MSEESATILENTAEEPKTPENPPENPPEKSSEAPTQPPAQLPAQPPARKPGRPAGSKDRVPRRKIRVEPFPEPVAMTPPRAESAPPTAHPKAPFKAPPKAAPAAPAPREPSPPTPRTLYRQTSEHLVNLRSAMNDQRRMSVAERYTANLHSWMA